MIYKSILGLVPSFQAIGLLSRNIQFAKQGKGVVKTALSSFIGIPLLSKTADLIKGL